MASLLLSAEANVNCTTQQQNEYSTPLHMAASQADAEMVGLLLQASADVEAQDQVPSDVQSGLTYRSGRTLR